MNYEVNQKHLSQPAECLLLGISEENGVEHWRIFEKSVNNVKFKQYLEELREANAGKKIALFLDNLSVHHSKKTKAILERLEIPTIFNCVSAPELNPIEMAFSILKRKFYRERSAALVMNVKPDLLELIRNGIEGLEIEKIRNFIRHCLKLIDE